MYASDHFASINLHRRPFEPMFDEVLLVGTSCQLRIFWNLLLLAAVAVFIGIVRAQRHFDVASAVLGPKRGIEIRLMHECHENISLDRILVETGNTALEN